MYYIYSITNLINGKIYIGQTNNPSRRFAAHRHSAFNKPTQLIHKAIVKHGYDNFCFQIIFVARAQVDIDWAESEIIKQYNSLNKEYGYNISDGADISWNRNLPTEKQPFYGKHHTDITKNKISVALSGISKPHNKEWSNNISKALIGRKLQSELTRQKLSNRKNNAKLDWDKVKEIRVKFASAKITYVELSKEYDVSSKSIENIIKGKTWKE